MTKANQPAAGNRRVHTFPSPHRTPPPQVDTLTEPSHLLYRIARACQKLDGSRSTVYRLVKDKKLVLVKLGERDHRSQHESVHPAARSAQRWVGLDPSIFRAPSAAELGSWPGSQPPYRRLTTSKPLINKALEQ